MQPIRSKDLQREAPTLVGWWTVSLLMALAFLCHFNRISMSVAGTEKIMPDFGVSEVRMGTIYSAYLFVYTLFMMPGGWLIDRLGAKFALGLMAFGSALLVFATGAVGWLAAAASFVPALFVVRASLGLVSVPMHPGAARAVALWIPVDSRVLANSLVGAAALVGIAGTYYLFGSLIDAFGWPLAFVISSIVTLAVALVWVLGTASRPATAAEPAEVDAVEIADQSMATSDSRDALAEWLSLLANRSVVFLTLSYAAVGYFQYLFFFWLQYYFEKVLKLGKDDGRWYTTIPMLAMAAGMFAGGWIADWIGQRVEPFRGRALVAMVGMVGGALLLFCGVLAQEPVWVVTWFSCSMALVGMSEGPFWTTAVELGGEQGGMSAAIINTGGNAGGILAPVVTPWLSTYLGWQGAVPVAGAVCLAGAVLWIWIRPTRQR